MFAFLRSATPSTPPVLVVCNFTPVPRHGYRIGVPRAGGWREILNTDAEFYGGSEPRQWRQRSDAGQSQRTVSRSRSN